MKIRRLLSLLLALALAVSAIPTAADAAGPEPWDGTATDTSWYVSTEGEFAISDAADLAGLATLVNAGTDFGGKTLTLTTDLDLNAKPWTPIGDQWGIHFDGVFDGGGHMLSNLYIGGAGTASYLGLFGRTGTGSIVRNLVIDDCQITAGAYSVGAVVGFAEGTVTACSVSGSVGGAENVGGIAGLVGGGTVSDCSTTGLSVGGGYRAGGIVGLVSGGLISGCTATGTVTDGTGGDSWDIGGIAGRAAVSTLRDCSVTNAVSGDSGVGGIVGSTDSCTVQDCRSVGSVSSTKQYGGGIAGVTMNTIVADCHSEGATFLAPAGQFAGGLVGMADGGTVLDSSSATGTVDGTNAKGVGGVAGMLRGTAKDCYAGGSVIGWMAVGGVAGIVGAGAAVETCYSSASVTAGIAVASGRIAAWVDGTARHCYFTVRAGDGTPGIGNYTPEEQVVNDVAAKTADEFQSGEVAWLLNTANGAVDNRGVWSSGTTAPVFADELDQPATCRIVLTNRANPLGAVYGVLYSDASGTISLPDPASIDPKYFFGWFADQDYSQPYEVPAQFVTDVTLYGNFGERIVSLGDYNAYYTGHEVPYTGTMTDNADSISSQGLVLTYYTDASGAIKTTASNSGAASAGGVPVRAGRYYVQATAAADDILNIDAAASDYAAMWIMIEPTYHNVSAVQSEGGAVTLSSLSVESHSSVTFTVTPDEGYRIADVLVNGVSVGAVERYMIHAVTTDVIVKAVFRTAWENPFADVSADAWYYGAVAFVSERGLFMGTDRDSFGPDGTMTRGMAVTVLLRLSGVNAGDQVVSFADVPAGSWYACGVGWANASGVASGVGDSRFAPDVAVTCEQLAVMLFNYAKYAGADVSAPNGGQTGSFSDAGSMSIWAVEAMEWAVANELISGGGGSLHPSSDVTRAEVAAIVQRFVELMIR